MTNINQENQSHGFAIKRVLYGINSSQGNPFVLNPAIDNPDNGYRGPVLGI